MLVLIELNGKGRVGRAVEHGSVEIVAKCTGELTQSSLMDATNRCMAACYSGWIIFFNWRSIIARCIIDGEKRSDRTKYKQVDARANR